MEPSTVKVAQAMRFTRADRRLQPSVASANGLVRIDAGAHLRPNVVTPNAPPWLVGRVVTKARCHALLRRQGQVRGPTVFTGEVANVLEGLPAWHANPDITYRSTSQRRRRPEFGEVDLAGHTVPSAAALQIGGRLDLVQMEQGVQVADMATRTLDMATLMHPQHAYANACVAVNAAVNFENWQQDISRHREKLFRRHLFEMLEPRRHSRGVRLAREIVARADAGAGSVLEAGFLWMLHCWIRPRIHWRSQFRVQFGGATYFCDAAIPSRLLSLEFDGAQKFGADSRTWHRESTRFLRRAQDFGRNGWTTIRVTAPDLMDMEAAMAKLGQDLARFGVARGEPGGPLWQPFS